jgi:amino acid transporter
MPPWLLTGATYVGIALLVLILGVLWWWVPKWQVNRLRLTIYDPKAYADVEDNFRKTIGQLFGGVAVLLAAVFAYYQFKETLRETEKTRETSQKTSRDLLVSQQVSKGKAYPSASGTTKCCSRGE